MDGRISLFQRLDAAQRTLSRPIGCAGVALHSGAPVEMRLLPGELNSGIVFVRTDLPAAQAAIPALWNNVVDTTLCTVIANDRGARVATIEHLMAALHGCGVDNAVIEVDGPEVPILDGSSDPLVGLIGSAGTTAQPGSRRAIRVLHPVSVGDAGRGARLTPAPASTFTMELDFPDRPIAPQSGTVQLDDGSFRRHVAPARTFGFLEEVEALRRHGFARGGSLDNAIVLDGARVLNEGGLRFPDELVRHKLLDAIGDLYLAGMPIIGQFHGWRSGHAVNNALLHALFADDTAWVFDTPLPAPGAIAGYRAGIETGLTAGA